MNIPFTYQVIRSSRKTAAIQIKSDGSVLVRCPCFMKQADIEKMVQEKSPWILSHLNTFRQKTALPCFTPEELDYFVQKAKSEIPPRTYALAQQMGISYGRITIRCQHSRWGSCSSKGHLNFNCLLMLAPAEVMDYVIIHELCHRREMNHSPAFWAEVEKYMPDYKIHRNWLKSEGSKLIQRLPK